MLRERWCCDEPWLAPCSPRLLCRIAIEQGRSVVIVSHDQRIKDIADRVLWLEDGQLKDLVGDGY